MNRQHNWRKVPVSPLASKNQSRRHPVSGTIPSLATTEMAVNYYGYQFYLHLIRGTLIEA